MRQERPPSLSNSPEEERQELSKNLTESEKMAQTFARSKEKMSDQRTALIDALRNHADSGGNITKAEAHTIVSIIKDAEFTGGQLYMLVDIAVHAPAHRRFADAKDVESMPKEEDGWGIVVTNALYTLDHPRWWEHV